MMLLNRWEFNKDPSVVEGFQSQSGGENSIFSGSKMSFSKFVTEEGQEEQSK